MSLTHFTNAYIECALWSSTDDNGTSIDTIKDPSDFGRHAIASIREDCNTFYRLHGMLFENGDAAAGHDFWLTRNRHGAGFWDGDYTEEAGKILTSAAHGFGESDILVGYDGMLHVYPMKE